MEAYDLQVIPNAAGAELALANAPTADRADYWRAQGVSTADYPLIGSFAYVRKTETFAPEGAFRALVGFWQLRGGPAPIMVSIFHASERFKPSAGFGFPFGNPTPDRLLRLNADGSVLFYRCPRTDRLHGYEWDSLFMEPWNCPEPY